MRATITCVALLSALAACGGGSSAPDAMTATDAAMETDGPRADAAVADASDSMACDDPWSLRLVGGELDRMAADADGNVFVAGRGYGFEVFVDWGGGLLEALGSDDVLLAKYDRSGAHLWSYRLGGAERDYVYGLAVAPDGSVVIAGTFNGTASFGGDPMTTTADFDGYVAKFSPDGDLLWARQLVGPGAQVILHVAVADSGAVAVAGTFETSTVFAEDTHTSQGARDEFVAAYSAAGDELWFQPIGANTFVSLAGIAASDEIVVAGRFATEIDLGAGTVASVGEHDLFLVGYAEAGGDYSWSKTFGGVQEEFLVGVAVDRVSNDVVGIGNFRGTVDFGGGDVVAISATEQFVARYDSAGAFEWVRTFYNADIGDGAVSVGPSGEVMVAGEHTTADFGGGLIVTDGSGPDVFAAAYSADSGAHLWSHGYGGTGGGGARAAALEGGCPVVAGQFYYGIDFGQGELEPFGDATQAPFIAQVAP